MTLFSPGERVRIREDFPPGHIRTPVYLRGKAGVIERSFGEFENAETAAYRLPGAKKTVFKVRFAMTELWADYAGLETDVVVADIYEHWLNTVSDAP